MKSTYRYVNNPLSILMLGVFCVWSGANIFHILDHLWSKSLLCIFSLTSLWWHSTETARRWQDLMKVVCMEQRKEMTSCWHCSQSQLFSPDGPGPLWGDDQHWFCSSLLHKLLMNVLFTTRSVQKVKSSLRLSPGCQWVASLYHTFPWKRTAELPALGLRANASPKWSAGQDGSAVSRWHQISLWRCRSAFVGNMLIMKENKGVLGDCKQSRALD